MRKLIRLALGLALLAGLAFGGRLLYVKVRAHGAEAAKAKGRPNLPVPVEVGVHDTSVRAGPGHRTEVDPEPARTTPNGGCG